MAVSLDFVHPCPVCGSAWKVRMLTVLAGEPDGRVVEFWAGESDGSCSNVQCSISPSELEEFRETRRQLGWDRWLFRTG